MGDKIQFIGLLLGNVIFYCIAIALAWQAWKKMGILLPLFWAVTVAFKKLFSGILVVIIDQFAPASGMDGLINQVIAILEGLRGQSFATLYLKFPGFTGWESMAIYCLFLLLAWEDVRTFGREPRETTSRKAIGMVACLVMFASGFGVSSWNIQFGPMIKCAPDAKLPPISTTPAGPGTK